jgi:hypothetical protein
MPHQSDPRFCVLHALRVKGFAKVEVLAELTALPLADVEQHLTALQAEELALFREARALWQLSPGGRTAHAEALAADVSADGLREALTPPYTEFLAINEQFKELCGEWQLKDGAPNDHTHAAYDAKVVARLASIDSSAQPLCTAFSGVMARYSPYGVRLGDALVKVQSGDHHLFTGVMCNSYHDVWMELHEDLILTLGIDRAKEGSF